MRLTRRFSLSMLLALLTLVVQQGALRHELSHGFGARASELRDDVGAPLAPVCEECLAYSVVGSALPSSVHLLSPAFELPPPPVMVAVALAATAPRAYRARAPPFPRPS